MTEKRLKTCDIYHVSTPSRLTLGKSGRDRKGNYRYRALCLECQRIKTAQGRVLPKAYGVLPSLNWAAPEFLLCK